MKKLLERFCRYVQVETTAVEETDDYPSSAGQLELGRMLVDELKALKLADVTMSERGIVMATIPGNQDNVPTIAWLAHMDTSPEASGKNVKPIIHKNYDGKDIVLPGDSKQVIRVEDAEQLKEMVGKTIITSDGTTLLGADDKSGVAVVMTAADHLMAHPEIKHGPIRICYTCDEEVGRGTDHIDLDALGAIAAYTLDGESHGMIENETFSADLATVTVNGHNIHPGLATGRMVNAIRIAGEFISRMPWQRLAPETTSGREGFMHPYILKGGCDSTQIRIILRSFETAELPKQAKLLGQIAATLEAEHPRVKIDIDITEQYRNMVEGMNKEPRAVGKVQQAMKNLGRNYQLESIRGGTDGSRLTEKGLPTPNLSTGMHTFHSPLEFACLDEMQQAVEVLVELAQCWAKSED